jgi:hypothetical protein
MTNVGRALPPAAFDFDLQTGVEQLKKFVESQK